jgi:hypothetical protein
MPSYVCGWFILVEFLWTNPNSLMFFLKLNQLKKCNNVVILSLIAFPTWVILARTEPNERGFYTIYDAKCHLLFKIT